MRLYRIVSETGEQGWLGPKIRVNQLYEHKTLEDTISLQVICLGTLVTPISLWARHGAAVPSHADRGNKPPCLFHALRCHC